MTATEQNTIDTTPVDSKPIKESTAETPLPGKPDTCNTENKSTSKKADDEDDLDDLDDLLDDFADDVLKQAPGAAASNAGESNIDTNVTDNKSSSELNTGIDELIKDLKIEDPETQKQFETLVKQFDNVHREEVEKNPASFDNVMKEAMQRLKSSGKTIDEQIKSDQMAAGADDMLNQLLSGMGGGGSGDLDMSKLLVDMLEQLSSKEVLYEPIKDLNTKFPDYLNEKKDTLPADQHSNYTKQYNITTEILAIFEAPGYDDNDKVKRDKVNVLLEQLQELGQPPSDLVGDAGDFPGFGGGAADGASGLEGFDFNDKDLPKNFEKELEEGCKQQ